MGEISIRRERGIPIPRFQGTAKTEKQSGPAQAQQTQQTQRSSSARAAATLSETLRQLMTQVDQMGRQLRQGRQTLQNGEASLAEVEDLLGRLETLAQEAAGDNAPDRAALQKSAELLRSEIDRIAQAGIKAGLFQEGELANGLDALVDAVMEGLSAKKGGESLPSWLQQGLSSDPPDKNALLTALGLNSSASGPELLAALSRFPLDSSSTTSYLASLYLGAVISGGAPTSAVDLEAAAQGLAQFLDAVAAGLSPDEALELLTGGAFGSLADFQAQFSGGTAPGLEMFLMTLLLSGDSAPVNPSLLALMAGSGGDLSMLMDLLGSLGGGEGLLDLLGGSASNAPQAALTQAQAQSLTQLFGTLQATGTDLSGASFDPETNQLTLTALNDLILRGLPGGQEAPALRLSGSGPVTIQQVTLSLLTANASQLQLLTSGENTVGQLRLGANTVLTLGGNGLLNLGQLLGEEGSVLRLTGGAVALSPQEAQSLASIVMDGPASLLAARGTLVVNPQGQPLEAFDLVWKALLPQWSALTALAVDGRQGQLALRLSGHPDPGRLWLLKGDSSQGFPAHSVVLRGRDEAGRLRTRYAYVRWDQKSGSFQEITMYPNPFTVTGGEEGVDWRYEQETQTLHILTAQVTAVSGGTGTDANREPFSGRLALADGLGQIELTLDGAACIVADGPAFRLGQDNDVTLLLQRGTENLFESGPGCAGISLGDNTSLHIDQAKGSGPDGTLTATGGSGGPGIGPDSSADQEKPGSILIQGGAITATGSGGGAGIGGALGSPAGDIRIQGGRITAQAACAAAAIGAGIQGACGDITITGTARVIKAQGGGPDGDIGGCLFGNCGRVQVTPGTDIGSAKLWTKKGLSLQMGDTTVTLPRFRVSSQALRLEGIDLRTRETAQAAIAGLTASRRWVSRLQKTYGAMYDQLEQDFGGIQRRSSVVRSSSEAGNLLFDLRELLQDYPMSSFLQPSSTGEDVSQLFR